MEEQVKRIVRMEAMLDRVLAAHDPASIREELRALEDYYFGPLWREDHAADEAGLLPRELKRGVLAQDTLWDLFHP